MIKKKEMFSTNGAAALHVAINSGTSPLEILELHPISGKVSARWLIVLYLLREHRMNAAEISEMLEVHPRTITKMLHNLDRLRKADPKVMELIQQMVGPDLKGGAPHIAESLKASTGRFVCEQKS